MSGLRRGRLRLGAALLAWGGLLLCGHAVCRAEEAPLLRGWLRTEVQMLLHGENAFAKREGWLRLELRRRVERARLFADVDIRSWAPPVEGAPERTEVSLREGYLSLDLGPVTLSLGKRIVSWGQADEFNPVDVVNPEDLREFLALEKIDRKIGLNMLHAQAYLGRTALEALWIPVGEGWRFAPEGSIWELAPFRLIREYAEIFPGIRLEDEESPPQTLANSEIALRTMTTLSGLDLGFMVFHGMDRIPHFIRMPDDEGLRLIPRRSRITVLGTELAGALGAWGVRGEAAWFRNRRVSVLELTAPVDWVETDSLQWILGIDRSIGDHGYLNIQFLQWRLFDYPHRLVEPERLDALTFDLEWFTLEQDWTLTLGGIADLGENEQLAILQLEHALLGAARISLGVAAVLGRSEFGYLGQFADNDLAFLRFEYDF